ncbi:hypothetical protein CK203_085831 [Vitis vinifera]|uniref:Uncharacterized protein n=1 Tax=Vitis vinifera TaxID=29760 RepID=A0A438DIC9_VITVI|nr:hypothetical protein CK203_085831 [Vitis vinifera]
MVGCKTPFALLEIETPKHSKNCYPAKMARADDWLLNEMLRSSYDPGVLVVLERVKDPISDSESKLAMLREHFAGIVIKELSAGHCPHDELPEEVNYIICDWIATIESKLLLV